MRSDYVNMAFTGGSSWSVVIMSALKVASHSETGINSDWAALKGSCFSIYKGVKGNTHSLSFHNIIVIVIRLKSTVVLSLL